MKDVLFSELVKVFEALENTSSGNLMRDILSGFLKQIPPSDLDKVVYLILGSIAPEYEKVNLGFAENSVISVLEEMTGDSLKHRARKLGDIGLLAKEVVSNKGSLTVKNVFECLHKIARVSGAGSIKRKSFILKELLSKANSSEAKFIVRIMLGKLRLGVAENTVLDSLAIAFAGSKEAKDVIESAYTVCPDIGLIAKIVAKGLSKLRNIRLKVGRPVKMMLAERAKSVSDIVNRMNGVFTVEEKYDGERVQAHFDGKNIILFSRRLENITDQFPDVVEALRKAVCCKSLIIEGEIVAGDRVKILPFQLLMQRRRKYKVEHFRERIPASVFLFDILLKDNAVFISKPYPERRKALESAISESAKVLMAQQVQCSNVIDLNSFFRKALSRGCEGVIVKSNSKDSFYQAGKRGFFWIKWKKEYVKGLQDTFDLVVVGGFYGRGKRAGTFGALLCAAYNEKEDVFETFCKLGSGFSDEELKNLPKMFKKSSDKPKFVRSSMEPDVWFEPKVVAEVLGAEITESPLHTCGFSKGRGFALRFPRFVRWRLDKNPKQATTVKEIMKLNV